MLPVTFRAIVLWSCQGFAGWHITSAKRGDNIEQAMTKLLEEALEVWYSMRVFVFCVLGGMLDVMHVVVVVLVDSARAGTWFPPWLC